MHSPATGHLREQRINLVYSKIYFSYPPMSHSFATPILPISLCPAPSVWATLVPVTEFELDHWAPHPMPSMCKKTDPATSIPYVSFLHYCSHFLFTQLASCGSATVSLDQGCNNIVEPVGLDMSPSHFNRQTCGGAGAHYVIMLSGRLFILTSSSHTVTSSPPVVSSIGGGSWLFRANLLPA